MEENKDFTLLRPFDIEAATSGAAITNEDGYFEWTYVAGPDSCGKVILKIVKTGGMPGRIGLFTHPCNTDSLRMAPLAWVEGKPVYKGDVLWHRSGNQLTIVSKLEGLQNNDLDTNSGWCSSSNLIWTSPKVKREGWVNIYPPNSDYWIASTSHVYNTPDEANRFVHPNHIACVRIEWEE